MSLRDNDPFAELTHRAETVGVTSTDYLQRLLLREPAPIPAHISGSVPWPDAQRCIKKSIASLDAGRGISAEQVHRNLERYKKSRRKHQQG